MPIDFESAKYERQRRWDERTRLIPPLQFPPDWLVKLAMPFGDTTARFYVKKGDRYVSVYFDTEDSLGCVGQPYWEMYPDERGSEKRFLAGEEQELIAAIGVALDSVILNNRQLF